MKLVFLWLHEPNMYERIVAIKENALPSSAGFLCKAPPKAYSTPVESIQFLIKFKTLTTTLYKSASILQ
jgi:hypothetical protein